MEEVSNQKELFMQVRDDRPHVCEVCNKKLTKPEFQCFSHCLSKGSHPEFKLDTNNIGLVCGRGQCHSLHDQSFEGIQGIVTRRLRKGLHTPYNLTFRINKDDREESD